MNVNRSLAVPTDASGLVNQRGKSLRASSPEALVVNGSAVSERGSKRRRRLLSGDPDDLVRTAAGDVGALTTLAPAASVKYNILSKSKDDPVSLYPTAVDSRPLVARIANSLREGVILGHLKPGERIRQDDFTTHLGVSRTPLREALRLIENETWLISRPRVGLKWPT